jgi:hypothetical protein
MKENKRGASVFLSEMYGHVSSSRILRETSKKYVNLVEIGYRLDDCGSGVRLSAGARNFSLLYRVQTDSGAHPASYPTVSGTLSLGVKRPGREADHSPLYSKR